MSTATNSAPIERDHEHEIAIPIAAIERGTLEIIAGYKVHPLASMFPLIVGKEFDEFVEAAARAGRLPPAETNDGSLIDGRNRLRVQEVLRQRGIEIEVPVIEWRPIGDETVEEHIWAVNAHRRHLTDDQRAALALEFRPTIHAARQAKQAASRFGKNGAAAAAALSPPPDGQAGKPRRTSAEKDAASTVGAIATLARVSPHKARQANDLAKAVEKGEVSHSEINAVAAGEKRLCDVVPIKRASTKKKVTATEISLPDPSQILDAVPDVVDEPAPTEQEVHERWERLKLPFAISDHREVRRLLQQIIFEEQRQFDQ